MFSYIRGNIAYKDPTQVVLDVGGIGYEINISLQTYAMLDAKDTAQLWIHLAVKEDDMSLFGFGTEDEREIFRKLISVSGIGTTTARLILSGLRVDEIREGILYEDAQLFQQVKGIGKKTAQRLILDLKDKIADVGVSLGADMKKGKVERNTAYNEALSALITLGYKKTHITKALKTVRGEIEQDAGSGEIIKMALKILS